MESESESLIPPEASNGRAAEGNCVAVRRGGEQPEAERQSQTRVNTIRPTDAASLLADGEACPGRGNRDAPQPSSRVWSRASEGGWCGNVVKVPCGSDETHRIQEPERGPVGVRAAIVAVKPGNAGGAKGGSEVKASSERSCEDKPARVPAGDKQAEEDLWETHKAERGVWSEKMLEALEKGVKGNKWFSLIDKVYAERTLELAWLKVRSNAGACGVDGITVRRFSKDSQKRLLAVKEQLKNRTYQTKPVKRVWISKTGSAEMRPLGIPTVKDRVVQQAVRMVLEPIFESGFHPHSYGFRPGRCCQDALRRVDAQLKEGRMHVVDVDIKGYFDAIPHNQLMDKVSAKVADGRVLERIKGFLESGVMEELNVHRSDSGTPQGGVISPLLANIYLDELDWQMAASGYAMTRYADDMVILCTSAQEAQRALERVSQWMEKAGLTLHPLKTRIVDMRERGAHFDFLGYRFKRSKRDRLVRLVRPKSEQKLKASLKVLTKPTSGCALEVTIQRINPKLRGWFGYFKQANRYQLSELDSWLRRRLRCILRKRNKKRPRHRGRDDYQRWPNSYFRELGLYSLAEAKRKSTPVSNLRKAPNGEPDAGDPHVRFGGRGGANQCAVPTPIFGWRRNDVWSQGGALF